MKKRYDTSTVIGRAIIAFKCKTMVELAEIFDLYPQDISNRIRRKSFIDLIEDEAKKRNINLDWIKTGQGEMLLNKEAGEKYKENLSEAVSNHSTETVQSPYHANAPAQPTFDDYMSHTSDVLNSPSIFSSALKSNIEAFYFGLRINKDLDAAHNLLRQHAQLFQEQNQTINNLKNKIDNLEAENKNLKNNNDNQEERIKSIEERLLALNTIKSA